MTVDFILLSPIKKKKRDNHKKESVEIETILYDI